MSQKAGIAVAIKILMAILLIGCLFKMPYGYYQFIRVACCAGFIYLGAIQRNIILIILSYATAILFNPIESIHFTRQLWNTLDGIIAGLLFLWIIIDSIMLYKTSVNEKYN